MKYKLKMNVLKILTIDRGTVSRLWFFPYLSVFLLYLAVCLVLLVIAFLGNNIPNYDA